MRRFLATFVFVTGCSLAAAAFGVEPPCPQNRVEFQVKVHSPWLAKVPILKEIFEEIGKQQEQAQAVQHTPVQQGPACPSAQERIGVDFAFPTVDGPVVMFSHPLLHGPGCVPNGCPLPAIGCAVCDEAKCLMAACGAGPCCEQAKCQAVATKSADCCCDDCECGTCKCSSSSLAHHHARLFERLLEASVERAALEATVEHQAAQGEEREEMFSSVAELMVENAQLKAKLEFQSERDEFHKQLAELAAQNAALKAEVTLTEAKAKLTIESTLLAVEREQLQARIAELEKKAGGEGIRTAKRPKTAR